MDDIMGHRIAIGLFYCETHSCCRHSKLNRCLNLISMMFDVFSILDVSCRETSATVILCSLQAYSKNILFLYMLIGWLIVCGDVEINPGPSQGTFIDFSSKHKKR